MTSDPTAELDSRFGDPQAGPTPWPDVAHLLESAELYWLTTVRAESSLRGRPFGSPTSTRYSASPMPTRPSTAACGISRSVTGCSAQARMPRPCPDRTGESVGV